MIAYSYIERNLKSLNQSFLRAKYAKQAEFFSKLAVLELCGWLEQSIDEMVSQCGSRIISSSEHVKFLEDRVRLTFGFDYKKNFRGLVSTVIGLGGLDKIEREIDSAILLNFKSALLSLKSSRDSLAHTYTRGSASNYDAPSITLSRFYHVAAGVKEYDRVIRSFTL